MSGTGTLDVMLLHPPQNRLGAWFCWQLPVPALLVAGHQQSCTTSLLLLQEQLQEAEALEKAGRIMCNVKLAAAWRGWLAVVEQRHHLKAKLGSALNLLVNRRLALAWRAWKVKSKEEMWT